MVGATVGPSLEGFRIGVTAAHRPDRQIALWQRLGAEVEWAAMVEIVPLEADVVDPLVGRLVAELPGVVVFTSRAGVLGMLTSADRLGRSHELGLALDRARIVTTSPEASAELSIFGFSVDATSRSSEPEAVVELLEHPVFRSRSIAVQLDGDAVDEWASNLGALGYEPLILPIYRWGPARDAAAAEQFVRRALAGRLDAVTFISRGAVEQFAAIAGRLDPDGDLSAATAACLNAGCAARAERLGFGEVLTPERSGLGAMVRTVAAAFGERSLVIRLAGRRLTMQGRLVHLDSEPLSLSDRELEVLVKLAERPGAVVSKSELVRAVWGEDTDTHVAEVSIARLRQRLGAAGAEIETVIRRGYRLNVDRVETPS